MGVALCFMAPTDQDTTYANTDALTTAVLDARPDW